MAELLQGKAESVQKGEIVMLLEEAFEPLTIVNKSVVDDGYGGVTTIWTNGATIYGALVLDDSSSATIAEALGAVQTYTLTVHKDTELDFHSVIKRADGRTFRIENNGDDKKTPMSAGLDMRQYRCKEWQTN